jgi:hypothetical protein
MADAGGIESEAAAQGRRTPLNVMKQKQHFDFMGILVTASSFLLIMKQAALCVAGKEEADGVVKKNFQ